MAEISKTADHALDVLLELSDSGPATPVELARKLGLNRTVIHRLLASLQSHGFVVRRGDGYVLGAALARIADRVEPTLRAAAMPVMEQLAGKLAETIVAHIADGEHAVVLQQVVPATHLVRVQHQIGSRHSLAAGASGRALLAFLDQPVVDRVVANSPNSDRLRRQLDDVREAGFAISHDELQDGVYGLAVPVRDAAGEVLASLAVVVPSERATVIADHKDAMLDAALRVSRRIARHPVAVAAS